MHPHNEHLRTQTTSTIKIIPLRKVCNRQKEITSHFLLVFARGAVPLHSPSSVSWQRSNQFERFKSNEIELTTRRGGGWEGVRTLTWAERWSSSWNELGSDGKTVAIYSMPKWEWPGDPAGAAVEWRGIALYRAITIISIATRHGSSTIICTGGLTSVSITLAFARTRGPRQTIRK